MAELKLDTSTYTFDQLEQDYKGFMSPIVEVIVDGKALIRETPAAVTKVKVDLAMGASADTCSFTVSNLFDPVKREFQWVDDYFALGKEVEIQMGYVDKLKPVFTGLITSLSFSCDENPSLTVNGTDKSFLMMIDNKSQTWKEKKYSDIVKEIGGKYGLTMNVDDTPNQMSRISKLESQSDFQFISHLAKLSNFDFFIIGKNLYFQKPLSSTTPMLSLMWGLTLRSFSVDANLSGQVSSYTVRSMETEKKDVWEAKAASSDVKKLGSNSKTGASVVESIGSYFSKYESSKKIDSVEEGKERAKATLNSTAMQFISGSGESIGIPEIRSGRYIKLEGVGTRLSQPYLMTSVSHSIDGSGYVTSFSVKGNAI